jgi:methionyl-tRNA formyltransferase
MKYVFFGTPEFSAIILRKLIQSGLAPVAVVSNPDRPVGRRQIITPPPVKVVAQEFPEIKIFQPEKIEDSFAQELSGLGADFFVVVAYAKILPKSIVEIPPGATLGVHPSLLPKFRGASPIQSVILAGEEQTGITLYLLDERMDHGKVVAQSAFALSGKETYESLSKKLAEMSGELLVGILPRFAEGVLTPQPQDEKNATYTKKFSTQDAFVSEEDLRDAMSGNAAKAIAIDRKIRALNPEPGVWTQASNLMIGPLSIVGKRVKLLGSELKEGVLVLKKIQIEGCTTIEV